MSILSLRKKKQTWYVKIIDSNKLFGHKTLKLSEYKGYSKEQMEREFTTLWGKEHSIVFYS